MSTIKTFGDVDARSLEQLERCMAAGDAEFGVLCADHHPGYSQPIGGGIAYEGYVSPSGVGYDIGCGNKAARTALTRGRPRRARRRRGGDARDHAPDLVRHGRAGSRSASTTGAGRGSATPTSRRSASSRSCRVAARHGRLRQPLRERDGGRGRPHLGGRALRLARLRPQDRLGLPRARAGPRVRREGARGRDGLAAGAVEAGSELGDAYVAAMQLAGEYAYAGRDVVVGEGARDPRRRGGARGAQPPQLRVAGGALRPHLLGGAEGLHARRGPGRRASSAARWATTRSSSRASSRPTNEQALHSTVHGAGRVMSRTQAAGPGPSAQALRVRHRDCDRSGRDGRCDVHDPYKD